MSAELIRNVPIPKIMEKKIKQHDLRRDLNWFSSAQQFLVNALPVANHPLISVLYRAAQRAADNDKELFLRNADSKFLAIAFNQALEHGKHGTKIVLPIHLFEKIPIKLRQHLSIPISPEPVLIKKFGSIPYKGSIVDIDNSDKEEVLYRIKYEDGDCEQMNSKELWPCIDDYNKMQGGRIEKSSST